MIKREDCKERVLYRIHSRNLEFGVFDAQDGGFIGLREKFGETYIFKEFHYDNGAPFGTVRPEEALPETLPAEILLAASRPGSVCGGCDQFVDFDEKLPPKERWFHLVESSCKEVRPHSRGNPDFGKWLLVMEDKYRSK